MILKWDFSLKWYSNEKKSLRFIYSHSAPLILLIFLPEFRKSCQISTRLKRNETKGALNETRLKQNEIGKNLSLAHSDQNRENLARTVQDLNGTRSREKWTKLAKIWVSLMPELRSWNPPKPYLLLMIWMKKKKPLQFLIFIACHSQTIKTKSRCYKTFYGRNLRIFAIS